TGDASALWLALSALSGTGLVGVTILGRKKRDEI
ncbi:MAG: LPXTG cell wall anchor domain-containing protein, partial [Bacteroidaceae bacterium]|nr:LPXTG cell wall anchor domain-containing protein [Bacteroidaceae bacterium]